MDRKAYVKQWRARNRARLAAYEAARPKRSRPGRYKPVPKDETPEAREARLAAQAAARAARDPEVIARDRERRAARERARRAAMTPEERAEIERRYAAARDADPARREAYLERRRAFDRKRRAIRAELRRHHKPAAVGEVFKTKLYSNELYAAVMAELGAMKAGDWRDDIAAEAILIVLEHGMAPKAAVKAARKALSADSYRTVSMDASNQYGETLHDYLSTETCDG